MNPGTNSLAGEWPQIVGVGRSHEIGRLEGAATLDLRIEALLAALADAGVSLEAVDGLVAWQPRDGLGRTNSSVTVAERLGLKLRYFADTSLSGVASGAMILEAMSAIQMGRCRTVVCVGGDAQYASRTNRQTGTVPNFGRKASVGAARAPVLYGLCARKHMAKYGTTSVDFARVAVALRSHASRTEGAQRRTPITIDDHQQSRMIADPYRLLDCSQTTDGAAAIVLSAVDGGSSSRNVAITGYGSAALYDDPIAYLDSAGEAARLASEQAFAMAGVGPAEIGFAEIYDPFTFVVIDTLEQYGFCGYGEARDFIEAGEIELTGSLPVNTHGGLLSFGHIGGMMHIHEAVTQLRGEAAGRQVSAERGVVSSQSGVMGMHITLVLERASPL